MDGVHCVESRTPARVPVRGGFSTRKASCCARLHGICPNSDSISRKRSGPTEPPPTRRSRLPAGVRPGRTARRPHVGENPPPACGSTARARGSCIDPRCGRIGRPDRGAAYCLASDSQESVYADFTPGQPPPLSRPRLRRSRSASKIACDCSKVRNRFCGSRVSAPRDLRASISARCRSIRWRPARTCRHAIS